MAWKRTQLGRIVKKSQEHQKFEKVPEFSLQIKLPPGMDTITLKNGQYLNLENKAFKLASLEANSGKMSEEAYISAKERIEKMPDYLFFEVIEVKKES